MVYLEVKHGFVWIDHTAQHKAFVNSEKDKFSSIAFHYLYVFEHKLAARCQSLFTLALVEVPHGKVTPTWDIRDQLTHYNLGVADIGVFLAQRWLWHFFKGGYMNIHVFDYFVVICVLKLYNGSVQGTKAELIRLESSVHPAIVQVGI